MKYAQGFTISCILTPFQIFREPRSYKTNGESLGEVGEEEHKSNKERSKGSGTTRKYGNQVPSRKNQGTAECSK